VSSIPSIGYSNLDYANCIDTSRSISGYCYSLGSSIISWCSQKQKVVADSSCYAKYVALYDTSHKASFLWQLLDGLGFYDPNPTPLHCNNDAISHLTEDHVFHPQVKHIRVKFHHTHDMVTKGQLWVTQVCSCNNLTDILMKPLGHIDFLCLYGYCKQHCLYSVRRSGKKLPALHMRRHSLSHLRRSFLTTNLWTVTYTLWYILDLLIHTPHRHLLL